MPDKEWPSVSHSERHRLPMLHCALHKTNRLSLRQKDIAGEDARNKLPRIHLRSKVYSVLWANRPVSDHEKSVCSIQADVRPYRGHRPTSGSHGSDQTDGHFLSVPPVCHPKRRRPPLPAYSIKQ